MVWEMDESPASVSKATVTPECMCDWSIEAVAMLLLYLLNLLSLLSVLYLLYRLCLLLSHPLSLTLL